ncbi:MAG: indole-3-glycerol phosphate synthase TrpC [Candidatus Omnitrophica bacterium]|nr:indole-3-glycerol phosphate synthase TrpC [Candidatus Omnitrophota bacterium]MCB9721333.1 indole-3-glycerol phosphate synthase TrpC [Candidatus Omnitrophota bacterium]
MPNDFLTRIIDYKRELIAQKSDYYRALRDKIEGTDITPYRVFQKALEGRDRISLIAEIKKASPSLGVIREDFDVLKIAGAYRDHHAAAVSVLTEDKWFLGKPEYIRRVSEYTRLPVLMKDFFIDVNQVFEAFAHGASAILLIAAVLTDERMVELKRAADDLDLDCLVEIHDEPELRRVLELDMPIIGINNRNLHTFEVTLDTCRRLIPLIPKDRIVVAESGIKSHTDVRELHQLGARAVLIGETFMRAPDIGAKVDELMGAES